jgi:beta-galactosidase
MKRTLVGLLLLTAGVLQAQTPEWENPRIFSINNDYTRTTALPYETAAQALENEYATSPYYLSLNGTWKFKWVPKPPTVLSIFTRKTTMSAPGMISKCRQLGGKRVR